ncbi:hypothetical protein MASR2M18_00190 [Ignavibacteria bacterium]|nr:T9SS type A sorting domain-containing protein [Bacteroidota bacterium]
MMYELPLNLRTGESSAIIEGGVISKYSFMNGGRIYTSHTVAVYKIFKGKINGYNVEVITEGGHIGEKAMIVIPNLELQTGDAGIFFLENAALPYNSTSSENQFTPYGSAQGFIKYDAYDASGYDVFRRYEHITNDVYAPIISQTGTMYRDISALPFPVIAPKEKPEQTAAPQATISAFSPPTVTAGTFTELTVRGSGFGTNTGSAAVQFSNADAGGVGYVNAPPDHIRSWKDNEIKVWVPSVAGATACTGKIRVVTSGGAVAVSSQQLTILYSVLGYYFGASFQSHLVSTNGAGGYTFYLNNNFSTNKQATAALQRSMTTWRCATGINLGFEPSKTTPISCAKEDGKNIIAFSGAGCPLPQGALGVTYIYPSNTPCLTSDSGLQRVYIKEMDMLFTTTPPGGWNYGPGATTGNKYDFESVVVHELGHVHQLGHINAPDKLMHYAEFPNKDVRQPSSESSLAGALNVLNRSVNLKCDLHKIEPVSKTNCTHGAPAARIAISGNEFGCPPLTIKLVDSSYYNPTSWSWDADGNGSIDFTTRDGSFTYTKAGNYTVRLRVSNSTGFDTASYSIIVDEPPTTTAGSDRVICKDSSIRLAMATTGGRKPYLYNWQPSDGLSNAASSTPLAKPSVTTTYIVTVTDRNNCIVYDTLTISVIEPKPATITQRGDTLIASGGLSYRWLLNGEEIVNQTNRYLIPETSGKYSVAVTDSSGGCSTRSQDIVITISGIHDKITASDFTAYPNPTDGIVRFSLISPESVEVRIYSTTGELLISDYFPPFTVSPSISLESLPVGIYTAVARQGMNSEYIRIIRY